MENDRRAKAAVTVPLGLAVARRALVVAVVAVLVAIAALVAALLTGSDSDPPEADSGGQAVPDVAAVQAAASEAVAMAEAAAARAEASVAVASAAVTSAEEAAIMAQEAATKAQEAAGMAFEASVTADTSATKAAAAEAALVAVPAETDPAAIADDVADSETSTDDTEAAAEAVDDEPEPTGEAEPEPTDEAEQAPEDPAVSLPGEPYEFGPAAGAGLAVVGVSHDSALNVRDVPVGEIIARLENVMDGVRDPAVNVRDPDSDEVVAMLDLQQGVVATGNTRKLPTTIWYEIRVDDAVGWASAAYLAPLGSSREATAEVVEALGGIPTADALRDLGLQVAGVFSSSGEVQSRTMVSSRPGVFEALGNVTIDVLGLPDDSVQGYRIEVGADAAQEDGYGTGPFTLRFVNATPICDTYRGVSEEGLCN